MSFTRTTHFKILGLLLSAAFVLSSPRATAATYSWQTGGTTNTWSTGGADTNWFIDAGSTLSSWVDANDAVFSAAAGETITLSGTVTPVSTAISGNGAWIFGGTGSIGGGTMSKGGTGALTFTNTSNAFSSISVSAGPTSGNNQTTAALGISNYSQLGSGTITFSNTANLSAIYSSATTAGSVSNNMVISGSAVTTQFSGVNNAGRAVSLDGVISGGIAGGTLFFTSGAGGGVGAFVLNNPNNTFTGTLTLDRGALDFTSNAALGNANNTIRLDVGNITAGTRGLRFGANNITISSGHAVNVISSTHIDTQTFTGSEIAGAVTISSGATLNKLGTNTLTISGVVSGAGGVTSAAGVLLLNNNANAYTGASNASGGVLAGTTANAFGNTSGINISGTGTLSLRGDADTSFTRLTGGALHTVTISGTGATINVDQASVAGTAAKTMSIGNIGTSSTAATYAINFTGANATGLTALAITGPVSAATGTVTLNNTNITGTTTLASYTSANTTGGESLRFTGNGSTTITGAITPSSTALSVSKSGTGTLTLNGASTYTGDTTVTAGTIRLGDITSTPGTYASIGATGSLVTTGQTANVVVSLGGNTGVAATLVNNIVLGTGFRTDMNILSGSATTGREVTLSGQITGGAAGGVRLYINTDTAGGSLGVVRLTNAANTFAGNVQVNRGGLAITSDAALGNAANRVILDIGVATQVGLRFDGSGITSARDVQLGANDQHFNTNGNNASLTGAISNLVPANAGNLVKTGSGALTLTGSNSYTGTTTVRTGSLILGAGTGTTGTGAVTIQSGATVLGTGTVRGSTFTAQSGSTVQAGNGIAQGDYGTLTFTPASGSGNFNFQSGSNVILGINPGGVGDLLNFNGLSNGTLLFNGNLQVTPLTGYVPTTVETFNLLDWMNLSTTTFASRFTAGSYSGFLLGNGDDSLGFDLPDISGSGYGWDISQFTTNGTISTVFIIPEPSRALLMLIGSIGLMMRRRRHTLSV